MGQQSSLKKKQETTAPRPLFIYGTLRATKLLAWALTGDATKINQVVPLMQPGLVSGVQRYALKHCDYPAVIKHSDPEATVDGYLLRLKTHIQRKKLDNFEGDTYTPVPVSVQLTDQHGQATGVVVDADMYLWSGSMDQIEQKAWDFDLFVKERLDDWIDLFEGMELVSEEEA